MRSPVRAATDATRPCASPLAGTCRIIGRNDSVFRSGDAPWHLACCWTRAPASQPSTRGHDAPDLQREAPAPVRGRVRDRPPDVAVLLNANAKAVNADVRARAVRRWSRATTSSSRRPTRRRARIAEEVVARRYGTVFTGGGDGTFVGWVNRILESAERRSARPRASACSPSAPGTRSPRWSARPRGATPRTSPAIVRGEVGTVRRLDLLTCEGRRSAVRRRRHRRRGPERLQLAEAAPRRHAHRAARRRAPRLRPRHRAPLRPAPRLRAPRRPTARS